MKRLNEILLYLSGFHPETVRRKAKTRKKRAFGNSIVLMVFAPLIGYAAAHGPTGEFSGASILFGFMVAVPTFVLAVFMFRWSLRPEQSPPNG
jgi:hypothetical protein